MHIRSAKPRDASAIVEVCVETITVSCRVDHKGQTGTIAQWLSNKTEENLKAWIANPKLKLATAVHENRVIGVGMIDAKGHISLTYVLPQFQGIGAGRRLLSGLEQYARDFGCEELWLESTKSAVGFYEYCGFIRSGGVQLFLGMETIPMRKKVAQQGASTQPSVAKAPSGE